MIIDIAAFPLLHKAVKLELFQIFAQSGEALRFVGGCVRDAFLGVAATDIDLATTASPEQMIAIFNESNIKWVPTGINFGTITAVADGTPFQITSLRQDWQTDGRHAVVRFGTDWLEDAKRRDFTFNALYADENGKIFDYFDGLKDLGAGIVRFIGDPEARIEEDYLRILRFFRFYARFGKVPPSPELLALFALKKPGLSILSRERITGEIMHLLAASSPLPALQFMVASTIFQAVFEGTLPEAAFAALLALEKHLQLPPQGLRRLMLLQPIDFRLANVEKTHYHEVRNLVHQLPLALKPMKQDWEQELYKYGQAQVLDAYLLKLAHGLACQQIGMDDIDFQGLPWHHWEKPDFSLKGQDLIDQLGLNPGPELGKHLKACEGWWVSQNFKPDSEACLRWIHSRLQ